VLDDVEVGHHDAVGPDDEPGADAATGLPAEGVGLEQVGRDVDDRRADRLDHLHDGIEGGIGRPDVDGRR